MKLAFFIFTVFVTALPLHAQTSIMVEKVSNALVIGPIAGNRGLEFGVKNILEILRREGAGCRHGVGPLRRRDELLRTVLWKRGRAAQQAARAAYRDGQR